MSVEGRIESHGVDGGRGDPVAAQGRRKALQGAKTTRAGARSFGIAARQAPEDLEGQRGDA
jgi:hypothetical protein